MIQLTLIIGREVSISLIRISSNIDTLVFPLLTCRRKGHLAEDILKARGLNSRVSISLYVLVQKALNTYRLTSFIVVENTQLSAQI